jgi:carbon storage regulator
MLVLSRKEGESIVIGDDIVVTVLEVRAGQIRIGIDAPRTLQVHRQEIYRQVIEANQDAVARSRASVDIVRHRAKP